MLYFGMKTAVSLPDELFASADELAERLGLSRSELYARAVEEFLARHRDEDVTALLNEVYAEEPSGLPPDLRRAQARSVGSEDW
jgi:metal-responsive CopG/Arc/MetJ family transcriptional regulator